MAELRPSHQPRRFLLPHPQTAEAGAPGASFRANCRALHRAGVGYEVTVNQHGVFAKAISVDNGKTPTTTEYDFFIPWEGISGLRKPAILLDPAIFVDLGPHYCEFYFAKRSQADEAALRLKQAFPNRFKIQVGPASCCLLPDFGIRLLFGWRWGFGRSSSFCFASGVTVGTKQPSLDCRSFVRLENLANRQVYVFHPIPEPLLKSPVDGRFVHWLHPIPHDELP